MLLIVHLFSCEENAQRGYTDVGVPWEIFSKSYLETFSSETTQNAFLSLYTH